MQDLFTKYMNLLHTSQHVSNNKNNNILGLSPSIKKG